MKRALFVLSGLLAGALLLSAVAVAAQEGSGGADGKAIFLAQKCNMCHDVSTVGITATTKSEKMKGPDLKGIGKDVDWIMKYLKKEVDLDGKKHTKKFTGSDDELKVLAEWIAAQK
ncbi:MAG: hypothetical protein Kow00109_14240 [Acidobacteriota bacterium]